MSSVRRAIQVIGLLARKGPFGVRAVAQELDLPLGSTQRILQDLAAENVIERTPDGEWDLSFRLLEYTGLQLDRTQLPELARPFAERIAAATRETVNLYLLSGLRSVCIDKVRGNEGMRLDVPIGAHDVIYFGGAGKALLAYVSEAKRQEVLAGTLTARTPNTITDREALLRELEAVRARGYSIDDEEAVMGVYCIGMPIFDRHGQPTAAMSITGPSPKRAGAEDIAPLVAMLAEACGHVSKRLGYRGAYPPVAGKSGAASRAVA